MRLSAGHRALWATLLLVAVAAAALAVVCADGAHTSGVGLIDRACAVMTHSSVIGSAREGGGDVLILSPLVAVVAGIVLALGVGLGAGFDISSSLAPIGRSVGSLNGRLRL